jgi:hypothetical protein
MKKFSCEGSLLALTTDAAKYSSEIQELTKVETGDTPLRDFPDVSSLYVKVYNTLGTSQSAA